MSNTEHLASFLDAVERSAGPGVDRDLSNQAHRLLKRIPDWNDRINFARWLYWNVRRVSVCSIQSALGMRWKDLIVYTPREWGPCAWCGEMIVINNRSSWDWCATDGIYYELEDGRGMWNKDVHTGDCWKQMQAASLRHYSATRGDSGEPLKGSARHLFRRDAPTIFGRVPPEVLDDDLAIGLKPIRERSQVGTARIGSVDVRVRITPTEEV